jgi:RNA polymerase sigma-70 factor (sigma-E family)
MGMRENPEFESFVRARSGNLLRTAVLLTGDYGHAEDMLQTALLRTLRRWPAARDAPEAYVRQVLVNLCRDRRRRLLARPRETTLLTDTPVASPVTGPAEQVGQRQLLVKALTQLPAGQRHVIVLRYFEDLPVTETATALGISPGTVKSYTARALATLRSVLADDDDSHDNRITEVFHAH